MHRFADALFHVPAVVGLDLALQAVEVAVAMRVLVDEGGDVRHRRAHRLPHRLRRVERRLLRDVRNAQALLRLQGAVVGALETGKDLQQRRLAGAVAADQADALAGLEGEVGVIEQRDMPEGQLGVEECDDGHEAADYPGSGTRAPAP